MRLLKLCAYAALGYVIYELYQGIRQGEMGAGMRGGGSRIGSRQLRRALNEGTGRMNITGEGRGTVAETADNAGTVMRHTVGRGVIHT